jgi:hypothetical protein
MGYGDLAEYSVMGDGFNLHATGPGDYATVPDRPSTNQWWYRKHSVCKHPDCSTIIQDKSTTCNQHRHWWRRTKQNAKALYDVLKEKYEQGEDVEDELLVVGWFLIKIAIMKGAP